MASKKRELKEEAVIRKIANGAGLLLLFLLSLLVTGAGAIGGAAAAYKIGGGWVENIVAFLTQRFDYPSWADWQIYAALGLLALGLATPLVLLAKGVIQALGPLFKERSNNKAVKRDSDARSYYNRAKYYFEQKNYEGALADYNKAIELHREEPIYFFFIERAKCLQWLERGKEAAEDYRQAAACMLADAARLDEIEKEERKVDEEPPAKPKRFSEWLGWMVLAVFVAVVGLVIFACPLLGQASAKRAEAYILYGNQYENDQAYKSSIRANSAALLFLPEYESPAQYNQRGVTYGHFGEHEKAIKDYSRAIKVSEDHYWWKDKYSLSDYYFNRANEYYVTHDYAKAIDDQLAAMKARGYNAGEWEYNTLARYYDAAGNKTKADEARAEAEKYASP